MQTVHLTINLPDIIPFDDRAALQMQVLYVKSLVDAGTIDFNDPAQRDAVLSWYKQVAPHIQLTTEENTAAKDAAWAKRGVTHERIEVLRQEIKDDLARLDASAIVVAATAGADLAQKPTASNPQASSLHSASNQSAA